MTRRRIVGSLLALSAAAFAAVTAPPLARAEPKAKAPAVAPAATASPAASAPAASQPRELVTILPGDWPVILSAPHGGRLPIAGATTRTGANVLIKKGVKNTFTMAFDGNVDQIALQLADEVQKRTGKRPYVVVANFSRRFVDANRGPEEAYEADAGRAVYDQYHEAIAKFRAGINAKWRRGLILDIHGHGRDPSAIIRGTADWATVRHLVEEFGKESVTGPGGLLGPLAAAGNPFVPPADQPDEKEFASLNGGYITRNYGSFQGGNFDAVQLELGGKYRKPENIPTFVSQLADGLVPFARKYLLIGDAATRPAAGAAEKVDG